MKPEILAPAGSREALFAAVKAGADAVYAGGSLFSARAFAANFNNEELLEAIDYCHLFGVKLYMTVNTLMKDTEIEMLKDYLHPFYNAGLDGVIVQDVGVVNVIKKEFPDLDIHGSTQMSISSSSGAALLKDLGFTRVVPARELSLSEIKSIKEKVDIEIESFVHGAMCFAYSGKCLLSSFIGGRSGNRGRCAQPCRKCYEIDGRNEYAMSLKDMCTLEILPDLIDAGVDSFKIEGRMKNPTYVAATTRSYVMARDYYLKTKDKGASYQEFIKPLMKNMLDIYNRGGFYQGYYSTHNGKEMLAFDRPNHSGLLIGEVSKIAPPQIKINLCEDITAGDVVDIRRAFVELTSNVTAKKGETISLNGKEFKRIKAHDQVFRTRNNKLINEIDETIIKSERTILAKATIYAKVGEELRIVAESCDAGCGKVKAEVKGSVVETAKNAPTSKEALIDKMKKTGGTFVQLVSVDAEVSSDAFVQMSEFNNLRRQVIEDYKKKIIKENHPRIK